MHIPLEDCLMVNFRNLQRKKLKNPGHLVYLNINTALNLITNSGLLVLDYQYSLKSISAPSNLKSSPQKILYPLKWVISRISPFIYSRLFGISLLVLAKGNRKDV